jgi:hypothetical protein
MMAEEILEPVKRDDPSRTLNEDLAQGALVLAALLVLNVLTLNWVPFMWSLVLGLVYGIALLLRASATSDARD